MHLPNQMEVREAAIESRTVPLSIILLLIACLLAIIGGLVYWYSLVMAIPIPDPATATRPTAAENNEPESTTAEARTNATNVVSTSDELDALSADLDSTREIENLTPEITAIENELDAALNQ